MEGEVREPRDAERPERVQQAAPVDRAAQWEGAAPVDRTAQRERAAEVNRAAAVDRAAHPGPAAQEDQAAPLEGAAEVEPAAEAVRSKQAEQAEQGEHAAAVPCEGGHPRSDWHEYFMRIAEVVASRATCDRRRVGAVIVRDRIILSTGYNGSIRGLPHCDEVGHMMEDGHCVATIHAEANAILQAARNGVRIEGADIYTTASPCWSCFKTIANAGIRNIYYGAFYRDSRIFRTAEILGIQLVDLSAGRSDARQERD